MNVGNGDTYGLLLQSDALRPMIVGIEGYEQSCFLAGLERLRPLRVIVKHVKRRALPLGHHQGGRGAWSGAPDTTEFDGTIPLHAHHEAGVYMPSQPIHCAEVMGTRAN